MINNFLKTISFNLINLNKDEPDGEKSALKVAHSAFYTLVKSRNAEQVHKMLDSGYNPDERNVIKFLAHYYHFDLDYKRSHGYKMVGLVNDSVMRQREENPNIFKDSFFKKSVGQYYIAIYLRNLMRMDVQRVNFSKLDLNARITFVAKYEQLIKKIEDKESSFYTGDYKNKYKKLQEIINSGVSEVIQKLEINTSASGSLIAKKVEKLIGDKISPEFQNVITSIDTKMFEFAKTKISLDVEDSIIIKKIIEEDIPSMVSSVALLPLEMQSSYKNIEGVAVKDSLLKLLKSYKKTIDGIIDKTINAHAESVDKGLQINRAYIDKINQTRTNAQSTLDERDLKSLSVNKK